MPNTQYSILPAGDDGLAVGTGGRCVEEILGAAKVALAQSDEPVSGAGQEVIPGFQEANGGDLLLEASDRVLLFSRLEVPELDHVISPAAG